MLKIHVLKECKNPIVIMYCIKLPNVFLRQCNGIFTSYNKTPKPTQCNCKKGPLIEMAAAEAVTVNKVTLLTLSHT